MAWHVYELPPIDVGWDHLKTVTETLKKIAAASAMAKALGKSDGSEGDKFLENWKNAEELARRKGWEGDHRVEPVVLWLPGDVEFVYGFVIKQDNNGTTYVVSQVELEYLEDLA